VIGDDDQFQVNLQLKHSLFRIKVPMMEVKETAEDVKSTTKKVFEDRAYAIDACIVRIMKSRKTLAHSILMAEVFNQIKFPVKAADVKKRIAGLIDRDYIERDADNSQIYHYLAWFEVIARQSVV